jgi:GTP cyclohydrolase I
VLEAEQLCMTVRGEKRGAARAHAEAYAGVLAREGAARKRFHALVAGVPRRARRRR